MEKRVIYISVIFLLGSALLSGCDDSSLEGSKEELLRPVRTYLVGDSGKVNVREFPGVVDAVQKADLSFRVAGKLHKLLPNEGDDVAKEQLLAQLEQTDFKLQLKSRQAEYDKAKADFERASDLVKAGHISRSDYDELKARKTTSESNLAAAQQNLAYTTMTAPFAGRIAKRYVENFEEVAAKQTIFTLQDVSAFAIKINVPESIMIGIQREAERKLYATFENIPEERFPLTFKEVATQADPNSGTFQVTLSMSAVAKYNILPGMSATVHGQRVVSDPGYASSAYLPAHAVLDEGGQQYVFVVEADTGGTGLVKRRNVTIGELSNQGIEITRGLNTGDRVVIAGMSKMHDGLKVRLLEENRP